MQLSLLGSILSNLLLVLGTSIIVGGLRMPEFASYVEKTRITCCHHVSLLLHLLRLRQGTGFSGSTNTQCRPSSLRCWVVRGLEEQIQQQLGSVVELLEEARRPTPTARRLWC